MKLKIRGLVFVGFAAAVFAQSASAGITPPSLQDPAHPDSLKKTVTSQDYVDENFQERLQGSASDMYLTESGGSVTEKAAFIGWNYGQGGENKEWVKLEGKNELDSSHAYVEIVHDTKTSDKKHYVKMGDGALANTAALITAAGEGTGGNSATTLEQGRLPTAKAVYDFVTAEVSDVASSGITGNITYHTQKVAVFENGYTPTGSTTNPSLADLEHVHHWELIVPNSVVAESGTDIEGTNGTGPDQGEENNFTTAQAVYDFVHGDPNDPDSGYQPKANSSNPQVGIRTGDGTNTPYNSTWYGLAGGYADPSTGVGQQRYVSVTKTDQTNTVWVDLNNSMLISPSLTGAGATAISSQAGEKLATGDSVYDYSVPMNWTERGTAGSFAVANKKLVTDGSGNVILAEDTTANIPSDMPDECDTATGTHVCALVAYWAAASTDPNTGETTPAGLKYEWTIMAPTGN